MSLLYLLSSLPMLRFNSAPALSSAKFLESCREQLCAADASAAEALLFGQSAEHTFVAAWQDKETILRNAIARRRARSAGQNPARWTRPACGCDSQIEAEVEDAFLEADPLQREKELDRARWRVSEELQGPDPLSIKAVFAYAIKLSILARWTGLSVAQGCKTFDRLTQLTVPPNPDPAS